MSTNVKSHNILCKKLTFWCNFAKKYYLLQKNAKKINIFNTFESNKTKEENVVILKAVVTDQHINSWFG
jgi:hypothetical protein